MLPSATLHDLVVVVWVVLYHDLAHHDGLDHDTFLRIKLGRVNRAIPVEPCVR